MNDPVFEFRVVGHEPRPWGVGSPQWTWRAAVAAAVREAAIASSRAFPPTLTEAQFSSLSVEILFRLTPFRFRDADLDNLVKPVLDTLFRAKYVWAPPEAGEVSGVLFDFDDSRVVRLVLEKRQVASPTEAGIDVRIVSACDGPADRNSTKPCP